MGATRKNITTPGGIPGRTAFRITLGSDKCRTSHPGAESLMTPTASAKKPLVFKSTTPHLHLDLGSHPRLPGHLAVRSRWIDGTASLRSPEPSRVRQFSLADAQPRRHRFARCCRRAAEDQRRGYYAQKKASPGDGHAAPRTWAAKARATSSTADSSTPGLAPSEDHPRGSSRGPRPLPSFSEHQPQTMVIDTRLLRSAATSTGAGLLDQGKVEKLTWNIPLGRQYDGTITSSIRRATGGSAQQLRAVGTVPGIWRSACEDYSMQAP